MRIVVTIVTVDKNKREARDPLDVREELELIFKINMGALLFFLGDIYCNDVQALLRAEHDLILTVLPHADDIGHMLAMKAHPKRSLVHFPLRESLKVVFKNIL